jgi:WD repeat and SOF domain-containing protein 1
MSTKELSKMEYRDSLREKWRDVGEVAKIERQRFVPKTIHNATKLRREMDGAEKRKEGNRRRHAPRNRPSEKPKAERRKGIASLD